MDKKKTLSVSTHARHEQKKSALAQLKSSISQHIVVAVPPGGSPGVGPIGPPGVLTLQPSDPIYYTTGVVLFDVQGQRWGEIIDQIPVGDDSSKTDIQINALTTRTDDNTFELPSRAQYVIDVWFDNLKAEPDNHYVMISETTIFTVQAQPSDVVVTALYLNKLEIP